MDINVEISKIFLKYGIFDCEPGLAFLYQHEFCRILLNKMVAEIPSNQTLAVRGAGNDSGILMSYLSDENRKRIRYVIDKNKGMTIEGTVTIYPEEIQKYGIHSIIVGSYCYREQFKAELLSCMNSENILDPYDYFADHGVFCKGGFWEDTTGYQHITYLELNIALKYYEGSGGKKRAFYLRRIIAYLAEIRDFVNLEKFVKLYRDEGFDNDGRYTDFMEDVRAFADRIENIIKKRDKRDLLIDWIDNVKAEDFYGTDFALGMKDKACFFLNAYTVTPWTHFTQNAIFLGKYPIEGKTYLPQKFNAATSPFLKVLEDNGYIFKYIANPGLYQSQFDQENLVDFPAGFDRIVMNERAVSECSSRLQWEALRLRLLSESPICCFVHNLAETHPPYAYIGKENILDKNAVKYHLKGVNAISEQLKFYGRFRAEYQHHIYLSDHGEGGEYRRAYERGRTNIALIIDSPRISERRVDRLYSHINFSNIVSELLGNADKVNWNLICSDFIWIENPDLYNENGIKSKISRWLSGARIDMASFQVTGIRTMHDMYVRYAYGRELYFMLPDEETNLIDDPDMQKRIEQLKAAAPGNFIDIKSEPAFRHSHLLYDFLRLVPDEKIRW